MINIETMKELNTNYWTSTESKLQYRDLSKEEQQVRHNVFPSFEAGIIDEPVLIYYEIFDCHSAGYIDDCLYQRGDCYIKPNDVVLDLGANIGVFSRFAAAKGAKKIYSVEPTNENFLALLLNKPEMCEVFKVAISNNDNQLVQIAFKENCPGGSSIVKYDDGVLQNVMTMSINTLIKNGLIEQPDFIKMDIEGAEIFAFEGMSDDVLRKTRCLSMELHVEAIGEIEANKIYGRMESLGFKHWTLYNPDQNNIVHFVNSNLKP
jgi:FkbM family methyltransferase